MSDNTFGVIAEQYGAWARIESGATFEEAADVALSEGQGGKWLIVSTEEANFLHGSEVENGPGFWFDANGKEHQTR